MPPAPTTVQVRLNNITTSLKIAANTVKIVAESFNTPFLAEISITTLSLLENIQMVKQNRAICVQLMEETHKLLNAIVIVYLESDTSAELSPDVLKQLGRFAETLHKVHTFLESQQNGNKVKQFFRQGEMSTLLKDRRSGLKEAFAFFQVPAGNVMSNIAKMREDAEQQHKQILALIEAISDTTSSYQESTVQNFTSRMCSGSGKRIPLVRVVRGSYSVLEKF
ncbi:hypothetical protein K438DRAFT_1929994 [Mycena galopus ATCC 62051]|nr:hypothetical protein K438DRAFT_1929994 [Mycena galopus ATCC 62051]